MLKDIVCGVKAQVNNRVLNLENITELALTAFFAGGHVLLSGQAGLGKTKWAMALAHALGLNCKSERFCNDLKPNELQNIMFSQVFMAEAIGYAHPRVQSIITEAMENKAIIFGDKEHPNPFFVIATQDEGQTLPEFLRDRFMLKLTIPYPGIVAEKQLLQIYHESKTPEPAPLPVCNLEAIAKAKEEVQAVTVEDAVFNYIISIVETARRVGAVSVGPSPRGSIAMMMASKAYAALQGRDYVTTEDVRRFALPVLRHRLKLKPDALQEGVQVDHIIEGVLGGKKNV